MSNPQIFNIGGRWERCRYVDTHGLGPAYFLDKKNDLFISAGKDRWFQAPSGLWYPHIRGGANSNPGWNTNGAHYSISMDVSTAGSISSKSMNSNYLYGTSGDANGWFFFLPGSKTLNSIFYFVDSITGSPGALTFEIRDNSVTDVSSSPGTTVILTTTSTPSGVGWNEVTGLSQALSGDTPLWLVIGDAAGSVSDFYGVTLRLNGPTTSLNSFPNTFMKLLDTSDGWNTNTNDITGEPVYALYFSDDTAWGGVFTAVNSPTNDGDQKGFYMDGWQVDVKLFGVTWGSGSPADPIGVNVWQNTTGPAGSPFRATEMLYFRNSATAAVVAGFTQPYPILTANLPHRIVMDFGAGTSNGVPDRWSIGTVNGGGDARLKKAMHPGQGDWYYTEEDAGVWNDTLDEFPRFGLFIDDFTPDGGAAPPGNARVFPVVPGTRVFPVAPQS